MKVLFICKGNWYRSQIAEVVYNRLTNSNDGFSVGTYVGVSDEPENQSLENLFVGKFKEEGDILFEVMGSYNFDIRKKITKKLTANMLLDFDKVICMAEEPFVPLYLKESENILWWDIENRCDTYEIVQFNYQKIHMLVAQLIKDCALPGNLRLQLV